MEIRANVPVVVSIATIPSRIGAIKATLESLLAGALPPDLILVNTPKFCKLENSGYDIPDFLSDPAHFGGRVKHVECPVDWGPGTKILGPIPHLPPECILVIADDDIVYHKEFLKRIIDAQLADCNRAFSFYVYRSSGMSIGQGCDGLSIWSPHLEGIEDFAVQYVSGTTLIYHDDIWIAFFLMLKGVTVTGLPVPSDAPLVYEQVLPNNVLSDQRGELKRELILRTHLPRLLKEADVPVGARLRLFALKLHDDANDLARRIKRKASKLAGKTRRV